MLRYILAWIPMVFIAIINGVIRELTYGKYLEELHSHQVSTLSGILLFSLYLWTLKNFWRFKSSQQAIMVGLIWFGLTISFEFLFGHYIAGNSWNKLLSDYDILSGRVWLLFLFWIWISPWLVYRFWKK